VICGRKITRQQWQRLLSRLALGYGLMCTTLYFQQQRLMFFPAAKLEHTPALYQLPYQDVAMPIGRQRLHGWWIPAAQPDAPVLLYCHHNGMNIGGNVSQARQFHELGYAVLLFDYRGYGQSEGAFPSEPQVYEDAQAAWEYVVKGRGISADRVIIYGHSIGGAVAIDLAAKHPEAAALIVQSSFTSMREMTKRFGLDWVLPVELVLRQRFESLQKMRSIHMPVLVLTGTDDFQIPVTMGERLYDAAAGVKQLIIIPGGGHDNHLAPQYQQQLKQFIDSKMASIAPSSKLESIAGKWLDHFDAG
jgi:uncharacterized protein